MSILRPILHCLHNEGALWSEIATGFWVLYWLTKNYDWKQIEVGDLGNVTAGEDGRASFRLTDRLVKVIFCFFGVSPWSEILISVVSLANQVWDVIGRSVVVASKPDDLGLGSAPTSSLWVQSHYHGHHSQLQPSFIIYNTYLDSWLCYSICQGWQLWNRGGLWDYREKRWTGREHETDLCMWWGQHHFYPIFSTLVSSCTLCVIRSPDSGPCIQYSCILQVTIWDERNRPAAGPGRRAWSLHSTIYVINPTRYQDQAPTQIWLPVIVQWYCNLKNKIYSVKMESLKWSDAMQESNKILMVLK